MVELYLWHTVELADNFFSMKVSRPAICMAVFIFVPFMKLDLSSSIGIAPGVKRLSK